MLAEIAVGGDEGGGGFGVFFAEFRVREVGGGWGGLGVGGPGAAEEGFVAGDVEGGEVVGLG